MPGNMQHCHPWFCPSDQDIKDLIVFRNIDPKMVELASIVGVINQKLAEIFSNSCISSSVSYWIKVIFTQKQD
jgi:hypothetical protein